MLKLNVPTLDGVSDELKQFYSAQPDGTFLLQIEGYQDPGALIRAKQHERDAHNATKQNISQLEKTISQLEKDLEKKIMDF